MLNYNTAINKEIKLKDISIKEISPIMKINIRGKKREFFKAVGKILDMILPVEANTSSSSSKLTSIWLSPDEWMIASNFKIEKDSDQYTAFQDSLYNNISKSNLGAVIDITDQFVMLEFEGKSIYELFASGSPFNFNEFKEKKGATTQTLLNNIDVIIHNKGKELVNLFVRRSFSEHLYSWINDSASRL